MKIVILGNCQGPVLEQLFLCAGTDVSLERTEPVFQFRQDQEDEIMTRLGAADVIFAQRVSDDFPISWVSTSSLRAAYGGKLLSWPNIYFDGYTPDIRYIRLHDIGQLQSPLDTYHYDLIAEQHRRGLSLREAIEAFQSDTGTAEQDDPFAASLSRLQTRETDVDVPISDYIEQAAKTRRCFYTPNHPYTFVLAEMGKRLADAAGISFDHARAAATPTLLDKIYIPTRPAIRRRFNLPFDRIPLHRGMEVTSTGGGQITLGKARSFMPQELVTEFYRIYDAVHEKYAVVHPE
jgi:hypothetical protein